MSESSYVNVDFPASPRRTSLSARRHLQSRRLAAYLTTLLPRPCTFSWTFLTHGAQQISSGQSVTRRKWGKGRNEGHATFDLGSGRGLLFGLNWIFTLKRDTLAKKETEQVNMRVRGALKQGRRKHFRIGQARVWP